jgi:hypothetical protein
MEERVVEPGSRPGVMGWRVSGAALVRTSLVLAFAALALGAPEPALAQDSRAEAHAQRQAEKAKVLRPYEPGRAERVIDGLSEVGLLTGAPPVGFYPWMGSIYSGGWVALGAGYRQMYADTGSFNVVGGYSLRNFKLLEGNFALPQFADGRARLQFDVRWVDAPNVKYYGVGNDTSPQDRVNYGYTPTTVGVTGLLTPTRWFTAGGGYDYVDIRTEPGTRGTNLAARFSPLDTPGLGANPTYGRVRAFAALDWRDPPGYSGSGGRYSVEVQDYAQRSGSGLSFRRVDAEVIQLFPILRANWVIALRGLATVTDADAGNAVPYFLMPSLGGGSLLRGYPDWRFRDNNRMLLTGEFRWTPARFVDMALFYDAGKVVPRRQDFSFDDLKNSYGIGIRFHGGAGTVMRWELARSDEAAFRFIWGFGAAF